MITTPNKQLLSEVNKTQALNDMILQNFCVKLICLWGCRGCDGRSGEIWVRKMNGECLPFSLDMPLSKALNPHRSSWNAFLVENRRMFPSENHWVKIDLIWVNIASTQYGFISPSTHWKAPRTMGCYDLRCYFLYYCWATNTNVANFYNLL